MKHFFAVVLCIILPALLFAGDNSQKPVPPAYKILYSFTGTPHDGQKPLAGVIRDAAGNLYGTTYNGGINNGDYCLGGTCGVVFKLDKTGKETVLHTFCSESNCTDGANPYASLIRDAEGNLYGTTSGGGAGDSGVVFKLDTTGQETVLYAFTGGTDGSFPAASLTMDATGNLYGTTSGGGDANSPYQDCEAGNGCGVVFKIDTTNTETVLYTFTGGADGGVPEAHVLLDKAGNLYGTTSEAAGGVFKLDNTGVETVLYSFPSCDPYGFGPGSLAGVIRDAAGNLYGTTYCGGYKQAGDVFKLDPNENFTELHYFSETDGENPTGNIVRESDGTIYGTTTFGGNGPCRRGCGVVFQIPRKGTSVLHNFGKKGDGSYPYGGLVRDAEGNFYGTTQSGGKYGFGTVFKITP